MPLVACCLLLDVVQVAVPRRRECRRHDKKIARDGGVGRAPFAPHAGIPGRIKRMVASWRDAVKSRWPFGPGLFAKLAEDATYSPRLRCARIATARRAAMHRFCAPRPGVVAVAEVTPGAVRRMTTAGYVELSLW